MSEKIEYNPIIGAFVNKGNDEKLTQAFEEIDGQSEVGQFTQDEVQEEDVEDEDV